MSMSKEWDHQYQCWNVYEWGTYESHSVLAGQTKKSFVRSFDSLKELEEHYPNLRESHRGDHQNTINHLPGENDPVPGGMYPDDWDDGI